jgi:o-succinylbenzoate synthase
MKIERVDLIHVEIPLREHFTTSFGKNLSQHSIIAKIYSEGFIAYGEATPFFAPAYCYEGIDSMKVVLGKFIIPHILGKKITGPEDFLKEVKFIKGNNFAKAALETAFWDLKTKKEKLPLWKLLGGKNTQVEVGVSIGLQSTINELLCKIEKHLNQGYRRIKIKIMRGNYELETLKNVRKSFPDIKLMVDANSSYTLEDINILKQFDNYNLLMIEQPLGEDDIVDHATLQKQINTPICLDESIHCLDDSRKALQLGSGKIINIKYSRVGGIVPSLEIHNYCQRAGIGIWIGGMLETGIGQRFKISLATLDNVKYPSDIEFSDRVLLEDIVNPNSFLSNGCVDANIEYQVDEKKLNYYTEDISIFKM